MKKAAKELGRFLRQHRGELSMQAKNDITVCLCPKADSKALWPNLALHHWAAALLHVHTPPTLRDEEIAAWGGESYRTRPSRNKQLDDRVESAESRLAAPLESHSQLTTHSMPEVGRVRRGVMVMPVSVSAHVTLFLIGKLGPAVRPWGGVKYGARRG